MAKAAPIKWCKWVVLAAATSLSACPVSCSDSDQPGGAQTSSSGDDSQQQSAKKSSPKSPSPPGAAGRVQSYPVMRVRAQSVTLTSTYPATLRGYQTVEIRPRVSGYIDQIRVEDGDQVFAGQVLFVLDNERYKQDVRSAKADVQAAQAGVRSAKTEVDRLEPLVDQQIISKYRLETARDQLKTSKAQLAQARAALASAQVNLDYTYVKSPANGAISEIPYRVGSLVDSTIDEPLTTVSDVSQVYAYFSMSERQLLQMTQSVAVEGGARRLRQRVRRLPDARLQLADGTTYDQRGPVGLASGLIDKTTGSASFRALFANPNNVLRTGASAQVVIPFERKNAIAIPKKATYEVQDKRFVYTVDQAQTVHSQPIEVAELSTQQMFVVDQGLGGGEVLVTAGMQSLRDGQHIEPDFP